ncbi:predicted protein [Thalassiosira pseudonana CCMP1335]|uniref:Uncharacterized protein n=1 Tax=Thalassiosira pseudonana TaxID=35128 RepID=B8LD50_THAPS|nr:predicted protein [Thalassiosira pseudonana CCMP1335]EED86748.1 predicted protein [Thalassiosira pseudonana CCMP1335]
MQLNPQGWMFQDLISCCTRFFNWRLSECTGTTSTGSSGLYYPNWSLESSTEHICLNDGNEPDYMIYNPSLYMSSDLETCCKKYYSWNYEACMGSTATGSSEWYVDWNLSICVQDCVGSAPCGGLAETWDSLYTSAAACCSGKLSWVDADTCVSESEGLSP